MQLIYPPSASGGRWSGGFAPVRQSSTLPGRIPPLPWESTLRIFLLLSSGHLFCIPWYLCLHRLFRALIPGRKASMSRKMRRGMRRIMRRKQNSRNERAFETVPPSASDWLRPGLPQLCDAIRLEPEADPWTANAPSDSLPRANAGLELHRRRFAELSLQVRRLKNEANGSLAS